MTSTTGRPGSPSERELERDKQYAARSAARRSWSRPWPRSCVFGLVWLVTITSPGLAAVQGDVLLTGTMRRRRSRGDLARLLGYNVVLFLIAEVLILVVALAGRTGAAVDVSPVMLPFRVIAVVYADVFRGIPTILLVFMLGVRRSRRSSSRGARTRSGWGLVALVLSYGAYVAEVFRAGIESIHPSQLASADTLGLSRWQAMRYVVVPQATRRVVPPAAQRLHLACRRTPPWSEIAGCSTRCSRRRTTPTTTSTTRRTWSWRRALHRAHDPARPIHRLAPAPRDGRERQFAGAR